MENKKVNTKNETLAKSKETNIESMISKAV